MHLSKTRVRGNQALLRSPGHKGCVPQGPHIFLGAEKSSYRRGGDSLPRMDPRYTYSKILSSLQGYFPAPDGHAYGAN